MTESLEALRGYVHFLHEREGVRQVKLSLAARQGLAKLAGSRRGKPSEVAAAVPGGGAFRSGSPAPHSTSMRTRSSPPPGTAAATFKAFTPPVVPEGPPLEISGSTKVEQLAHLAERAAACVKCPHLVARRHNVVFGAGDPNAKLMFVGEAPGEEEDLQGEPFVGKAGQLLTKMIMAMGLTREQVYIANIVK